MGNAGGAGGAGWPARTQAGVECKLCVKMGQGNFCYHHVGFSSSPSTKPSHHYNRSDDDEEEEEACRAGWPGITAAGVKCKVCIKKGQGVFCHLHVGPSSFPAAQPSHHYSCSDDDEEEEEEEEACGAGWPARTQAGVECKLCIKKGEGVFCHLHVGSSPFSSAKPSHHGYRSSDDEEEEEEEEEEACRAGWPAMTAAGVECKLCIKKGQGNFCYHHVGYSPKPTPGYRSSDDEEKEVDGPEWPMPRRNRANKEPAGGAGGARWPGITKKGEDCKICIKLGRGNFCHFHPAGSFAAKPILDNSSNSVEDEGVDGPVWPGITAKGEDCKKCIDLGRGNFCRHHPAGSSAAKPRRGPKPNLFRENDVRRKEAEVWAYRGNKDAYTLATKKDMEELVRRSDVVKVVEHVVEVQVMFTWFFLFPLLIHSCAYPLTPSHTHTHTPPFTPFPGV